MVGQPGELGRSVTLVGSDALSGCQCYAQHSCVAEEVFVSVAVGSRGKQSLSGRFPGRIHLFLPSSAVSSLVISY